MPDYKDTPIIMLTTEGTSEHLNEAINLGDCDFIVKPFDPRELNIKIAEFYKPRSGIEPETCALRVRCSTD